LFGLLPVINAQAWTNVDFEFRYPAANWPADPEVPSPNTREPGIDCGLHSFVWKRFKPFVERNSAIFELDFLDFPFKHHLL